MRNWLANSASVIVSALKWADSLSTASVGSELLKVEYAQHVIYDSLSDKLSSGGIILVFEYASNLLRSIAQFSL